MIRHDQSSHHAPHIERFDHDLRHPQHGPQPESPHRGGTLRTWEHESTTEVLREETSAPKKSVEIFFASCYLYPVAPRAPFKAPDVLCPCCCILRPRCWFVFGICVLHGATHCSNVSCAWRAVWTLVWVSLAIASVVKAGNMATSQCVKLCKFEF